jgi:uncharacterized protein DUF2806
MPDSLPTIRDWLSNWLGFQLPSLPMPQAMKNLDKAVGKILLAAGENAVERIKSNTGKVKAAGKISVEGMYRTEEEKRKLENRAATVKVAVDELNEKPPEQDAAAEIDDDWLNVFARMAEDKSSEELRSLFGKILAGEIRKPGSFSLRTMQFVSTLSKSEAEQISEFFSFVLFELIVPIKVDGEGLGPPVHARILMEELGMATQPSVIGGLVINVTVAPHTNFLMKANGSGIIIVNGSEREIKLPLESQVLTTPAKELIKIASPPLTEMGYLKEVAQIIFEKIRTGGHADEIVKLDTVQVVAGPVTQDRLTPIYRAAMPGQAKSEAPASSSPP